MKKTESIKLIIICAIVLMIAIGIGIYIFNNKQTEDSKYAFNDETTIRDETTVPETEPETTVPETEAATKVPDTTKAPETTKVPETEAPATEPVYVETAPDTVIGNPSKNGPKYVQDADPNTGISWDGVSPIIYTYTDGTTGTVPRDGATYEQDPYGSIVTYHTPETTDPNAPVYDGVHCTKCGRVKGTGENGTCNMKIGTPGPCNFCGEYMPTLTCHTCDEEE